MGTLTQNKDGDDRADGLGITADPALLPKSGSEAANPGSGVSTGKPVRPARRPPPMPPAIERGNVEAAAAVAVARPASEGGNFFHIRKKGQGYWTRMGTAMGAGLIGAFTVEFIYSERDTFHLGDGGGILACAIFALVYGLSVYFFMNRAASVDFLIATDSEMKKVNWTSRQELLGSTKVVIFFMFLIAAYLFAMDILFGYIFYWMGVLKASPL
jgi:preprotein translocase SecE subunit